MLVGGGGLGNLFIISLLQLSLYGWGGLCKQASIATGHLVMSTLYLSLVEQLVDIRIPCCSIACCRTCLAFEWPNYIRIQTKHGLLSRTASLYNALVFLMGLLWPQGPS